MSTFYRTLFLQEQLDRWHKKQYTSTHAWVPGMWTTIWQKTQSLNPKDYDLVSRNGNSITAVYTKQALSSFLKYVQIERVSGIWSDVEKNECGELDGVCAFNNPKDTFEYGHNTLAGKAEYETYVEFEGEYVCELPEDNGVVARVIRPTFGPCGVMAFRKRHKL